MKKSNLLLIFQNQKNLNLIQGKIKFVFFFQKTTKNEVEYIKKPRCYRFSQKHKNQIEL